ncbi:hypothetical protein M9Y10_021804 [Tritrichomonas musculus]|uniref:Amino acid transporter transmembrane domain-containing protein n=1 Tax=Tritrichomonas musculus TaxID=1915356 RepID=A0ABR2KSK5_9EUKA
MTILSHFGTIITIKLQKVLNAEGFPDIAFKLMGRPGSIFLAIMSLFYLQSCQLSYLILGSDMIISFFGIGNINMSTMWRRALVVLIYAFCIPIALSIPKKKPYLKYISTTTTIIVIYFDISMVIKGVIYFHNHHGINPSVSNARIDINVFSSLSIYSLAFALPVVVLPVIMKYERNLQKRYKASGASLILCFILVFLPGIFGYLIFGDQTKPNITQNFADKDILIVIVRIGFIFVVSFAYVSMSRSSIINWSDIIFKNSNPDAGLVRKRVICLFLTNIISLLIAMFLSNAKPALNIAGSIGGCMSDFFFRAILWIKYSNDKWYLWK